MWRRKQNKKENRKKMKDYLSEIKTPSLFDRTERPSELTMPMIEEYMSSLEELRHSFINTIIDKSVRTVKAYIAELGETRQEILKTGFVNNVNSADLAGGAMCDGEMGEMCSLFLHLNIIYRYLCSSIDKTVSFLTIAICEEACNLIDSAPKDETNKEDEAKEDETKEVEPQNTAPESNWLNVNEVCKRYKLPKNNVKDRKWRDKNNFPYYQDGPFARVIFNNEEVRLWIEEHIKAKHSGKC